MGISLTDVALVAAEQPAIDLGVIEDSQCERVRQIADVVLRPARQTAVQCAVLLYRHVQRLHSDHVTCRPPANSCDLKDRSQVK